MLTYAKLAQKPEHFKLLAGISVSEFDDKYKTIEERYAAHEETRLSNRKRKRRIGAGRKFRLDVRDRVLMVLIRSHFKATYKLLEYIFEVDATTACRDVKKMENIMQECMSVSGKNQRRVRKVASLDDLEHSCPGIRALIENEDGKKGILRRILKLKKRGDDLDSQVRPEKEQD